MAANYRPNQPAESIHSGLLLLSRLYAFTPHRRRRRSLCAGRHMSVDELLGVLAQIVVGVEGSIGNFPGHQKYR
jgi:hypothetical protein